MSMIYQATIQGCVWKEHTCVGCASAYRYLLDRTVTAAGGTPDEAREHAYRLLVRTVTTAIEPHPCPECGLYQPDMVAARRVRRHWYVLGGTLAFAVLFAVLAISGALAPLPACWVAAGALALALLVHLAIDLGGPNGDRDSNRRIAQEQQEAGQLLAGPRAEEAPVHAAGHGWTGLHGVAYLLLLAGIAGAALAEGARLSGGWPPNPGWWPVVLGPGDEGKVYFPERIRSIKGMWNGKAEVRVLNAREVGLASSRAITASTHTESWDRSIPVKSKEKSIGSSLWLRVHLPDEPALEGKELRLTLILDVNWPEVVGQGFENKQQEHSQTVAVAVGPRGSGRLYEHLWNGGLLAALVLSTTGAFLLTAASATFAHRALPSTLHVPKPPEGEGPPDDRVTG